MAATCPSCGASSATTDYCDSCGAAIAVAGPGAATDPAAGAGAGASAPSPCPSCGAARTADDVFCEVCGLDFATGRLPEPPPPPASAASPDASNAGAGEWSIVVEADRAFFESNHTESPGAVAFPAAAGPRRVPLVGDEVAVGRSSPSRGFFPGVDLGSPVNDPAVSHHHCVLRRQDDGSWAVVDEGSANGTWLIDATAPLEPNVVTPLRAGDRLHVGAFTRLTLERSTP
jgi:hypothetical protein